MKHIKSIAFLGLSVLMATTNGAFSKDAVSPSAAVARVNGQDITEADVKMAETELFNQIASVPVKARRKVLVEYLIENILLAQEAKKAKIDEAPDYKVRTQYYNRRALRDAYFEKKIVTGVTEADAKATYEKVSKEKEVNARHILVKTEDEAKAIYKELKAGGDFAKIAKEKSLDPGSKEKGGTLGFFRQGQMVPAFEKVAFGLANPGDISEPVKSRFGWHVIQLILKRDRKLPPYADVKPKVLTHLQQQKAGKLLEDLRKSAKIEMVDKSLDKPLDPPRGSN